jgi:hypothetical protein
MSYGTLGCGPASCIYEALVVLKDQTASSVPPGLKATVFRSIDDLRAHRAPADQIAWAEQTSLALHQLEQAVRRADFQQQATLRQEFDDLAERWLSTVVVAQ